MNNRKQKPAQYSAADWKDVESPALTPQQLAKMRAAADVMPDVVASFKKARGRPRSETVKVPVTIRLDADVLDAFKAAGSGWQTRINAVLTKLAPRNKRGRLLVTGRKESGGKESGAKESGGRTGDRKSRKPTTGKAAPRPGTKQA